VSWDVVGIGENSVDSVYVLPAAPQPGGALAKMRISDRRVLCGGQAATAVATCASLGLRSKYVGVTGSDDNGRRIRDELERRGVDIASVITRDTANRFAVILVDASTGERIVLWDRHESLRLREDELPADALASARVVHVDDVDEEVAIRAAASARAAGAIVTSDIDRVTPRTAELASSVTHAIFSLHVVAALTGVSGVEPALRRLRSRLDGVLVVTMGERGAAALHGDRFLHEPAFQVRAVDTTGAGDVFRGAFICALVNGEPVEQALRTGNAAAAVSCTRLGALNGVPTLDEVRELMAANVRG
jgi:sugar/nucleoside kinase (ribokinase family)